MRFLATAMLLATFATASFDGTQIETEPGGVAPQSCNWLLQEHKIVVGKSQAPVFEAQVKSGYQGYILGFSYGYFLATGEAPYDIPEVKETPYDTFVKVCREYPNTSLRDRFEAYAQGQLDGE